MRTALVEVPQSNLALRARALRQQAKQALQQFCTDKVLEHKLAARGFTYQFRFSDGASELRKTIVRMKTLFGRAIEKRIPYVEYTQQSFLETIDRQDFEIKLVSLPEPWTGTYDQFYRLNGDRRQNICLDSRFVKTLNRYVERLQRLCLSKALPLELVPTYTTIVANDGSPRPASETEHPIEVQYVFRIRVRLVYWQWRGSEYEDHRPIDEIVQELRNEGWTDFQIFERSSWSANLAAYGRPADYSRSYGRYGSFEKLFLYIPEILRVLRTLTRMTSYVPAAFSISALESA